MTRTQDSDVGGSIRSSSLAILNLRCCNRAPLMMSALALMVVLGVQSKGSAQTVIPTANEIILPQYAINGVTTASRLQYVCRLKLSGLTASATYRYYTGASTNATITTTSSPGNYFGIDNTSGAAGFIQGHTSGKSVNGTLLASNEFTSSNRYSQFATDASGNYTGWFSFDATSNAVYAAGSAVYIYVQLNNGAGGTSVTQAYRTTSTVTMLDYGTAGSATLASAFAGTTSIADEQMIFLYDNFAGTGRPVAGTWTENDGITTNFTTWYETAVAGNSGRWGVILPNVLANGVRRIEARNTTDGTLIRFSNSTTGFNGTINPTNGNTLASPNLLNSPDVVVTAPNGGESWAAGSLQTITWNNNTFSGNVDIQLSSDDGATYGTTLFGNIANTGSKSWTVTGSAGSTYRVRVRTTGGGTPSDDSDAAFSITCTAPSVSIVSNPDPATICTGGSVTFTATASGNGPLHYDWRRGGTSLGAADQNTLATGIAGTYDVVVTGACAPAANSNAIPIMVNANPTAATVGGPQTICANGTTTGLGGNTPTTGAGSWSVVSGGTGTFSTNTNPNATFTHTGGTGPIVLRWTISNAPCTASPADVSVTIVSACNDNDPCTTDSCVNGVCVFTPIVCNDNDPCTTDSCVNGVCVYAPIICNDNDPCTTDSCVNGVCVFTPIDCDDNDPCTTDSCVNGICVNTPINCDDSNPCTTDSCVNGVCVNTPTGTCDQLSLNVVGSGMVCAGNSLDVTLDVSGLSQAINGVQVLLQYDPALLSLSSVSPGNGSGSPWDAAMPIGLSDNAGAVNYALALVGTGSSASATVATLHFTVHLPGINTAPTSVVFRPNQGQFQTKLTRASDNGTVVPGKVDSGPITVGPRVTVTLQIQGLNHAVTRDVTFILTKCANLGSPQVISRSVAFNASGIGSVVLTGIDTGASYLAVVEGHTLQRRVPLSFTSCFATATLTGASQLISGDLQAVGVPQDNLVDILDFAIWVARLNSPVTDCGVGLPENCSIGADINGDGIQDTADFVAIQMNFFDVGDTAAACPPQRQNGAGLIDPVDDLALSRVCRLAMPVSRLPSAMRSSRQIDLNGDGVVDAKDIRAFARARGLTLLPQFEAKLSCLELSSSNP